MTAEPRIACVGLEPAVARLVDDAARRALGTLDLESAVSSLEICADDLAGDQDAWLHLRRGPGGGPPALIVYCHAAVFGSPRPATGTVFPPRAVWERQPGLESETPLTAAGFSRARADAFLHHHLLWGADVLGGRLRGGDVPASLAEAFAAAWAVTVDGRLARRELPGYPLSERRGRFSRLFSTGGVLMPEHWRTFQDLWDGQTARPREIVAACRRLPRLAA